MTPGATVQAAIELIAGIEAGTAPADDLVATYFRRHRFAGVKDRGAISEHIYAVLRHRAQLDWWIERKGEGLPTDARTRLLAALLLVEEWTFPQIAQACDGDRFRPYPLIGLEGRFLSAIEAEKLTHPDMPPEVRGNFPAWLHPHLEAALGRDLPMEMAALNRPAALDLRVNALKGDREEARTQLEVYGIKAGRTSLSPLGLRVFERIPLATLPLFKDGLVEVQDEGSQLAAILADAKPGMRVVDFCSGAGGKTLALAAAMGNRGHLIACDVSERRLERSGQRLRRAGVSIVQRRVLSNERDKWVKRHAQSFDRVFVDAPCTGTGTWRRNPDAKWRLKPVDLEELAALQKQILDSAARLVKPGGRLIYATCSMLREEDEEQAMDFLATHTQFSLVPIAEVWRDTIGSDCPVRGDMLRLSPGRHKTDGFFVAVMERAPLPAATPDPSVESAAESGDEASEP